MTTLLAARLSMRQDEFMIRLLISRITPKRRWAQFSLGTMFVIVTALCVWLGVFVNRANRQRETVVAIGARGGYVVYEFDRPPSVDAPWRERFRSVVGRDYLENIIEVHLYANQETQNGQEERFHEELQRRHLGYKFMGHIDLAEIGPPVDDHFLKVVAELTKVEVLHLAWNGIGDAALAHLAGLTNLRLLNLQHTNVTDSGLAALAGLTRLEYIWLKGTHVTDAGLVHLRGLTQLEGLDLDYTQITDAGLVELVPLTNLKVLRVTATDVTDAGLVHLKRLPQLRELYLDRTWVTVAGLAEIKKALPNCECEGATRLRRR
jgi:hypothetical protein